MNKNKLNMFNILAIGGLLTLTGCVGLKGSDESAVTKINTITFTPPSQIKWKQVKSQQKNGYILAEWIPQDSVDNNRALVRILYNRSVSDKSATDFLSTAIQPMKQSCTDIAIAPVKGGSAYKNQANAEVLCAQLSKANFGTASYFSVFSDGEANHLVMSEVKLPPSKKAGVVTPKNEAEKKWAQNAATLVALMNKFNQGIRVCDAEKKCQ